ncbi:MAG: hypothetical protein IPM94_08205 [bacterium]|nr:hypothetical protein [bacterium]
MVRAVSCSTPRFPGLVANIDRNGFDASLALLGRGGAIAGAGELLRVTFSADVTIAPEIDARRTDNGDLRVSQRPATGRRRRFRSLPPELPNPFNPMTTIAFALPEARQVRLGVYAGGRQPVRTLVDRTAAGGRTPSCDCWTTRSSAKRPGPIYRLVAARLPRSAR